MNANRYSFDTWFAFATEQLDALGSVGFHRDFRNGFGFESDLNRKAAMEAVIHAVSSFRDAFASAAPARPAAMARVANAAAAADRAAAASAGIAGDIVAQPVTVYGREREGKSGAILSIVSAAIDLGCAVMLFVAPTKVAPVQDFARKLRSVGFAGVLSTNRSDDENRHGANKILVCALNTPGDIERAHEFMTSHAADGRPTISIVDECDELTMGKGYSTVRVPAGPEEEEEDEDEEDDECTGEGEDGHTTHERVAKSEMLMRYLIQPRSLIFLVTATHFGTYAKNIGWWERRVSRGFPPRAQVRAVCGRGRPHDGARRLGAADRHALGQPHGASRVRGLR